MLHQYFFDTMLLITRLSHTLANKTSG